MKKLRSKAGLTLMEMMAALLVMVLLVVGMGTGMDAGMRVYRDSQFETDSAALADIMNTSMGDLLRYAERITPKEELSATDQAKLPEKMNFVFTNMEFGVLDGYFQISTQEKTEGMIQLLNLRDASSNKFLLNSGAYTDLRIVDMDICYVAANPSNLPFYFDYDEMKIVDVESDSTVTIDRGGFFYISYKIQSNVDSEKSREVVTVVRQMNAE